MFFELNLDQINLESWHQPPAKKSHLNMQECLITFF